MKQDFGVCIYRKSKEKNTLDAEWFSNTSETATICTGQAKRKNHLNSELKDEYHGDYVVTYYDENGEIDGIFDLEILREGKIYLLRWLLDGKIVCTGVGFETNEGLILSYANTD